MKEPDLAELHRVYEETKRQCAELEDSLFEEMLAEKSPIERAVMRRMREKLSAEMAQVTAEWEEMLSSGDGTGPRPAGTIRA